MGFEFKINAVRKINGENVIIEVEDQSWMNGDCVIHDEEAKYTVFSEDVVKDIYEEEEYICKYCLYENFDEKE